LSTALINQPAPPIAVSGWAQGESVNLKQLKGNVVLLEIFQVNCPGCFLHALPYAIELHQRYKEKGLRIIGIATAFEDFDKNTWNNLLALVNTGEVIGETLKHLSQNGLLDDGKLSYRLPFPVAMDELHKRSSEVSDDEIEAYVLEHVPQFYDLNQREQNLIRQRVTTYLSSLIYRPQTFETYKLKGTPSQVLIDQQGIVRKTCFGMDKEIEDLIITLIRQ
jgi:peroxiredoxin